MKKLRLWWWFLKALISKHRKVIVYASAISALFISFIPRLIPVIATLRPSPTIGLVGRYRASELPPVITKKLSRGLTAIDEQGNAIPDLAKNWTVSDEGKTYSFLLYPDGKWQDRTPLTSSDMRFDIENVETETPDPHVIIFKLKEPFAPFPTVLARPIFKNNLVGNGEYHVKSIKKNGEYIDQITLVNEKNHIVPYRFYKTTQEVITAFKLGEVSSIDDITTAPDLPKGDHSTIKSTRHADRYSAIFFNTKDEHLSEKSFRQALTYAIPGKQKDETRALSPINPHSWAYNPQVKPYNTDVGQTKELLHATFGDNEPPTLMLSTFSPYVDRADEIAKAWTDAGVKTDVRVVTSIPKDFQALLLGQQIPPDPDQYYLWHSTQSTNITHYASPKGDKLLEDGRQMIDQDKRVEIYQDFQRFLLEDCPAAFLEHITTYTVTRK